MADPTPPELPKLSPLPSQPGEQPPLSSGTQIQRAVALFLSGVSNPGVAQAMAEQFKQQDEQAKLDAENRFRSDLALTQAANAQAVQQFELKREQVGDIQQAQTEAQQAQLRGQAIAKGTLEATQAQAEETNFPTSEKAQLAKREQELQIKNLEMDLRVREASLARAKTELANAVDDAHAEQLKRVIDLMQIEVDKRRAIYQAAVSGQGGGLAFDPATGMPVASAGNAQAFQEAFTLEPTEQDRLLRLFKASAPAVPEAELKDLLGSALQIPAPWNRFTTDNWVKSINGLVNLVGPVAVPLAGAALAKSFVNGGLAEEDADKAAADVMTNEESPESAIQRGAKVLAAPGIFIGKAVGKILPGKRK